MRTTWNTELVKEKCIEFGIEFLDEKYIDNKFLHSFKCKCGKTFIRKWNHLLSEKSYLCLDCSGIVRYDINTVREYFKKLGYDLISHTYENVNKKLIFKDTLGYIYCMVFSVIIKGETPQKVIPSNPYSIQNIKLWCKLNNKPFILVSEEYEGNNKNLQWKCLKEDCGEIFEARWGNIFSQGCGCGYCNGKQVGLSNCLAIINPELASEWHPTLNGDLTPYDFTSGSHKDIWWLCSKNPKHVWKVNIKNREKYGCPYCNGNLPSEDYNLFTINPKVCELWDYSKNTIKPQQCTPNSEQKVWWICEKGHSWDCVIYNMNIKSKKCLNVDLCLHCSHKIPTDEYNLLIYNPELCKEWDYSKNKKLPEKYLPFSGKKVWWICKECKHEWKTTIAHRNNGKSCPNCSKSHGEKRIQADFDLKGIYYIPQKVFPNLIGIGLNPLSYDFYLPNHNILVEYQGQFHDGTVSYQTKEEFIKQQEHDKRKREYAKDNNIKFIEIWYKDFNKIEEILNEKIPLIYNI